MHHRLIDEYRLFIHPVVLGNGNRLLFEPGTAATALDLVETKTTSRGVALHVYRPAGEPTYGAVAPGASV